MKRALLLLVVTGLCVAADNDLYPQARALLQDAETLSKGVKAFDDRSNPAEWAGHLYARAGYLDDAKRAYARTASFPFALLEADVLFGQLPAADELLASIHEPLKKARAQLQVADVLWRMGQPSQVQTYLARAARSASAAGESAEHTQLLKTLEEDRQYMAGEPPQKLSPMPTPQQSAARPADIPQFPITADGLADLTPAEREERNNTDAALLEKLYGAMLARDRAALDSLRETVRPPFQQLLVEAAIEHLLLQERDPRAAQRIAESMTEVDDECRLAKAEAFSAVGTEWLRQGHSDPANAVFEKALLLVQSAKRWPLGQVTVLSTIAEGEAHSGLTATSRESLRTAEAIALQLPPEPEPIRGTARPMSRSHYRPEAYRLIFASAVRAHDLGTARGMIKLWGLASPYSVEEIARAWFYSGKTEEAIDYVKSIADTAERAKMELALAQDLLNQAGAPNF